MTIEEDRTVLERLQARLQTLLPQEDQNVGEEIEPVPMGSAALIYDADGRVAWNEVWQTFCDLALAGGPPHKGRLLLPGAPADVAAQPDRHAMVTDEICRAVTLVTGLPSERSTEDGWIVVGCDSDGMAGWLLRAITMENVSVRAEESVLYLPAGPDYRIDKEIKNVVTAIAKTCHYWSGHMWGFEQREIAELFAAMERDTPLIAPAQPGAWTGVDCPTIRAAVWMARMMMASNVLARREETTLFVPSDAAVEDRLALVRRLAVARGLL
jgi:sirohydrochlorin cobaltochelatase